VEGNAVREHPRLSEGVVLVVLSRKPDPDKDTYIFPDRERLPQVQVELELEPP
jgi:hypothetical protein